MDIVIFSHPEFLGHQSMPRYTRLLADGMTKREHNVRIWSPKPRAYKLAFFKSMAKWLGYVDQYVFFPQLIRRKIRRAGKGTLFVFMDHALGPWVPLVANRPHVIHCHDFLAQRSALGELEEHTTGWTGRVYQKWIRKGFSRGKHFISVSKQTQMDLHRFLPHTPVISEVIYNALTQSFAPGNRAQLRTKLTQLTKVDLSAGYILHVGGNHWYKNRIGVLEIYNAYRENYEKTIPLLMIGSPPDESLIEAHLESPFKGDIHFLVDCPDDRVKEAYAAADLMLFPSYEEGFGWPIAEAMASGCLVVTTKKAPMTEVAGTAGFYIPRSLDPRREGTWAREAAQVVDQILNLAPEDRKLAIDKGLENVKRFHKEPTLDKIEEVYEDILKNHTAL